MEIIGLKKGYKNMIKNNIKSICFVLFLIVNTSYAADFNEEIPSIPKDIFQTDGHLYEPCTRNSTGTEKKYMIFWPADRYSSTMVLVIHPKQIFLRTTTNNPNPNELYWLYDELKSEQYRLLCEFLDSKNENYLIEVGSGWGDYIGRGFKLYIDCSGNDSEEDFWLKTYSNLMFLLWEFNKQLYEKTDLITYPDYSFIENRKTVRIKTHPNDTRGEIEYIEK